MPALRKLDRAEIAAVEREQSRGIGAAIVAARRGEQLKLAAGGLGGMARQSEESSTACSTDEKLTAANHHAQSPSMALKPKVRPAPREIASPAVVAAPLSDTRKASSFA